MVLWGWLSSPEEKRASDVRTGAIAPDRSERKRCWDARDEFYACLDKHNVIDALSDEGKKIVDKECVPEHKKFEQNCASTWVTYFKRYRVAEHKKKMTLAKLQQENANEFAVDQRPK